MAKDKDSKLLKEAIADARTIKEIAVQNAKDMLQEAFTPKLQSMISDRLQREAEEDYEMDMEDEEDERESSVSGEAEYDVDDTGNIEDLELDLDFDQDGDMDLTFDTEEDDEGEEEEMEPVGGEEDMEMDFEDEEEETDEDDVDLEEVLSFLESSHGHEDEDMSEGDYAKKKHKNEGDYMKKDRSRDHDLDEIISELEADVDSEKDLDTMIENFLESLDNQVYDVDLNELQESVSGGDDEVFEIDLDRLEEEFNKPQRMVGTEGHEQGDYYDDDFMDGYDKVSSDDIGHHGGDDYIEVDLDMDPSSSDLGQMQYDTGQSDYDRSGEDGHDKVGRDDVRKHGPDDPAPGTEEDLDEGFLSDLLSEIEGRVSGQSSRSSERVERLKEQNEELRAKLDKHRQAVEILRNRINEVNLINSKLLYTNRLFKKYDLNEDQRIRVIEALDRATDKRGAKLVYSTLAEAFDSSASSSNASNSNDKSAKSSKRNLAEAISKGLNSKKKGTQRPKNESKILNEDVEMKDRMQKLANINQRKRRRNKRNK